MKNVGKHIYANFQLEAVNEVSTTKSAILIGGSGTGKSSLVNNLCGSSQKVQVGLSEVTKQPFKGICNRLNSNLVLEITDTPAIRRDHPERIDKLKHIIQSSKWNVILIQAKFDSRFEKVLADLKMNERLIEPKESSKLVYLISYGDLIKSHEQKSIMKDIDQYVKMKGLDKKKILIYSNRCSEMDLLASIIYSISQSQAESFQFNSKQNQQNSIQSTNILDGPSSSQQPNQQQKSFWAQIKKKLFCCRSKPATQ